MPSFFFAHKPHGQFFFDFFYGEKFFHNEKISLDENATLRQHHTLTLPQNKERLFHGIDNNKWQR